MRTPISVARGWKLALTMCGSALALAAGSQAYAQDAAPADASANAGSADTQSADRIEEIVVTARYRKENLQATPLAITALSGDDLAARSVTNVTDLSGQAPNLTINPGGAGYGPAAFATIRGIGMNDFSLAFEPGVAMYIDGVYEARPIGAAMDLLDLEQIEVLRGPQGTLFGQNAIGGAIHLISKKPDGNGGGYIEATMGRFDRRAIKASFDATLVPDRVFVRLSGSSNTRDGYFKVYDFACAHPDLAGSLLPTTTAKDCQVDTEGDVNIQTMRGAIRFIATDNLEFNVVADYENQHQKQPADKLAVIATSGDGAGYTPVWNATVAIPFYGIPYDDRFVTNSPYSSYNNFRSDITGLDYPNRNDVKQYGVSGTLDWRLGDHISLKSITAYRHYRADFGVNSSGSPLAINLTDEHDPHRQFSQELTLSGDNGPIEWTVGGYYYDGHDGDFGTAEVYPPTIIAFYFDDEQDQSNKAAFVHAVYHATEKLSVTGGIRYTDEKKSISILRRSLIDDELLFPVTDLSERDKKWSPMANIAYQWTPDVMTYIQVATGFRGGGFSPRPNDQTQIKSFGSESLTSYEAGFKSSLFDRRVRLNGAVFYSKYKGIQLPSLYVDDNNIIATVTQNVGKAHMEGAELELEIRPVTGFELNANAGYLHYKNDDLGSAAGVGGGPTLDTVPARTPKFTFSAGAQYEIPTAAGWTITPRADLVYQSKVYFNSSNTEFSSQDGYALVNARITFLAPGGDWSFAVFGTNLTNKVYSTGALDLIDGFGTGELSIAPPREWGVTARRSF
ncbi:MAG: TonB-dependent receptor [Candidatus Andeanibacterium colombiense]|uniref:TonB-dependent receptor n=1 Tax=Candidatus Andeanibacterium colombiense TaxID=3121345 RepID=A0AAJ6BP73_9SPHN|nr:MAG: TonB-dependent receptor [Sphingomonadaceae bacterium]